MRAIVAGRPCLRARRGEPRARREALQGPAVQAGADRRASRGRGDLHLHAGHVHRPVPRPARAEHERAEAGCVQAHVTSPAPTGAATRRTRCCSASTAPRGNRKAELDAHLKKLEEIEKRDHRRLGKELDLSRIHEEAGAGLIYWHPKGARIRLAIEDFWRSEHLEERLRAALHAAHRQGVAVGDLRPPRVLQAEHVLAHGDRRRRTITSSR